MGRAAPVELFWIPLGAGDTTGCVRWSGVVFEAASAAWQGRRPAALYHSALAVHLDGTRHVVEMTPAWGCPLPERGVVCEGPVGLAGLGRLRWFRYEVRCWPDGTLPDEAEAVGGPQPLVSDTRRARRLVDLVPSFPTFPPASAPDGPDKTMLGREQRAALLAELRAADRWAAVVWVSPSPWVTPERAGAEHWGGYATGRRLFADTIASAGVDDLVMVSGDAHMLALDDGTNTDLARSGGGGFPLLHAAALDGHGGVKGGPYTGPVLPGGGHFGTVEVRDDGRSMSLVLSGWDWRGTRLMRRRVDVSTR